MTKFFNNMGFGIGVALGAFAFVALTAFAIGILIGSGSITIQWNDDNPITVRYLEIQRRFEPLFLLRRGYRYLTFR